MRPGSNPNSVSGLLPFAPGTCSSLDFVSDGGANALYAGVSKDGLVSWVVRGSVIEVVSNKSQARLASWQFGAALKDTHTTITCVKEYSYRGSLKLLVGVSNVSLTGMLCVLDVPSSLVIKAVEIPHKVTSVEPVTNSWGDGLPVWTLNEQLRHYCGIVAIGTQTGEVYIIDMCLDDEGSLSDEIMPNKLHFISPRTRDIIQHRKDALSRSQQLAMILDEEANARSGFQYHKPDGSLIKCFRTDAVSVTCISCVPQIGSIALGFSFGCFQIWKLFIPVLEYSSQLDVDYIPIKHFAYQEPENDPKNFCYLWVGRSSTPLDIDEDSLSAVTLYQFSYNKRTMYSNYGVLYEELGSVYSRMDFDLTSQPLHMGSKSTISSRLISCSTLENCDYKSPSILSDEESFEGSHGPDLSVCLMVWESIDAVQTARTTYQLGLFDLNRWYHSQMPPILRCVAGSKDMCPYFAVCDLEDIVDLARPDSILAAHVSLDALRKFTNNSPMPPEQHFYPLSLAFNVLVVMESGVVKASYLGTQRQVLNDMEKKGPTGLLSPKDMYTACVSVGLLPRQLDLSTQNSTVMFQRESLMNLALEYNLVPFLVSCITQWAPGEFVHQGCTLKFLLDWAWNRVAQTKQTIDTTCVSLYDCSGVQLDQRSLQTIHQSYQSLIHLVSVFKALIGQSAPTTEQGLHELENKLLVVTIVCQHVQMVLWFVGAELLPEQDESDDLPFQHFVYPAQSLRRSFIDRRRQLQHLDSNIRGGDLLMIDGLLEHIGPAVKDLFDREGGDGLYPPPSLHALLNVYLLDGVDLIYKHSLVLYLLLDLVSLIDSSHQEKFAGNVSKFAHTFSIPASVVKQVQGFWLLDHEDFEEAMAVMLDSQVSDEMGDWQHFRVVKSLLYQGDSKMALRYLNTARPALTTAEQVKLKLTVLLANGLTSDALEYQRTYRDQTNERDLLYHLFLGCQQTKTVDHLLQLPLWDSERQLLVEYFTQSTEPHSQELLVFHYLQQARFVEAVRLNEKLKHTVLNEASAAARARAASRNAMVEGYTRVLPLAQRKLIFESHSLPKRNTTVRREVRRPQPLSTNITRARQTRVISQASLISSIMEKVHEVRDESEEESSRPGSTEPQLGPFVCTPVTPRRSDNLGVKKVVYPEITVMDMNTGTPTVSRRRSFTQRSSLSLTPPTTNRRSKLISAEAMAVLRTPIVERKTPAKLTSGSHPTPQSILKVRHFISHSPISQMRPSSSNESLNLSSSKLKTRLGKVSRGSTSQTGTPRSVSFAEPSFAASPKQLRFADIPKTLNTWKSMSEESLDSTPSPREVWDDSPTSDLDSPGSAKELVRRPLHLSEAEPAPDEDEEEAEDPTSVETLRETEERGEHTAVITDMTETATHRFQDEENEDMTDYTAFQSKNMSDKIEISDEDEEMETADSNEGSIQLRLSDSDSSVHSISETEEIKTVEDDFLPTPLMPEPLATVSFSMNTSHESRTSNISKHFTSSESPLREEVVEVTRIVKKEVSVTESPGIDLTSDEYLLCSENIDAEFKIPSPPSSPLYGGQQTTRLSTDTSLAKSTIDSHMGEASPQDKPIVTKTVSTDRPLQVEIPQWSTVSPQLSPRRSPRLQLKSPKIEKSSPPAQEKEEDAPKTLISFTPALAATVPEVLTDVNVSPPRADHSEQKSEIESSPHPEPLIKQEEELAVPKTPPRRSKVKEEIDIAVPKTPPRQSARAKQKQDHSLLKTPPRQSNTSQEMEVGRRTTTRRSTASHQEEVLESVRKTPPRKAKTVTQQETELRKTPPRKAKAKQLETSVKKTPPRKTKDKAELDHTLLKTPPRQSHISVPLTPPESSEDERPKHNLRSTDWKSPPVTPTRRSTRGHGKDHKSGDTTSTESVLKTETTELSVLKSETELATSSFSFSDPMQLDSVKPDLTSHLKPRTPVKSFIFSPPITRSHPKLRTDTAKASERQSLLLPVDTHTPASITDTLTSSSTTETLTSSSVKTQRRTTTSTRVETHSVTSAGVASRLASTTPASSTGTKNLPKRKGKKKVEASTPSDYDVVLISPNNPGTEDRINAPHVVTRQQAKPHTSQMTLRTSKRKKKIPKLFL